MSRIVAFLQNQWYKNPARVEKMLAQIEDAGEREKRRQRFATRALFAGCLTGTRLLQALGSPLCNAIYWENASTEISDFASASPPANLDHMRAVLDQQNPELVIAFGKTASNAMLQLRAPEAFIMGPHPAARGPETMAQLKRIAEEIHQRLAPF